MMRAARTMMVISIACFAWIGAKAQVDCQTSNKLACLVPFVTNGYLQSGSGNESTANQASIFNGPIGLQISQLPLAASAPGVTILTVNGNPEAFDNLGPILLDRPDSVGKGRLVLGFSFQQFNFNHLDGIGIGSIPFVYQNTIGSGEYPTQYFSQTVQVSLKYNQYVLVGTYGFPKKLDVSVVLPFARVSASGANTNSETYFIAANNTLGPGFPLKPTYTAGVASGIGDIQINVKRVLWSGGEAGKGSLATGLAVRLPTGDALNYLGSGAYGYNLYGLVSYKSRISPHAKIAYQWNTDSVLLNPLGTPGANRSLPGGVQYGAGADVALFKRLTASADLLANEFENSPSIALAKITIPVSSVAIPPAQTQTLSTINVTTSTYTAANLSAGLKWKPFRGKNLILYGNVLIPLNDVGLRSDPSPSGGLSYSFRP